MILDVSSSYFFTTFINLWAPCLPKLPCATIVTYLVAWCGQADNQPMRNATRPLYRFSRCANERNKYIKFENTHSQLKCMSQAHEHR